MKDYTITHPITGDQETYDTLAEAKREAKKQDYTPVYIDIYDWEEYEIRGDVTVINKGKQVL